MKCFSTQILVNAFDIRLMIYNITRISKLMVLFLILSVIIKREIQCGYKRVITLLNNVYLTFFLLNSGAAPVCLLGEGGGGQNCKNVIKFCASPEKKKSLTHSFFRLQQFFHTHFVMGYGYYHGHDRLR